MDNFTFQNQPTHWETRSLADCFDVSPLLRGSLVNPSQNDFILVINRRDQTSKVVEGDEYTVSNDKGEVSLLMKARDGVNAEFGKALLGSTAFSKWFSGLMSFGSSALEQGGASVLKRVTLSIPPIEEQLEIVLSLRVSSNFLDRHVKLMDQYNNTCAKLSEAIEYKVLSGEYGKREAVFTMRQAFSLWEKGLNKKKEPDLGNVKIYSKDEIAESSINAFIDVDDHTKVVFDLQEKIRRLEGANVSVEPVNEGVSKSRGLRP